MYKNRSEIPIICIVMLLQYFVVQAAELIAADDLFIDNGVLKLVDDISVPAEVSGTVEAMAVQEGEMVQAGAVLAKIQSTAVQLLIESAQVELETADRKANNELDILEAQKSEAVAKAELERVVAANAKTPNTFLQGEVDRYRLLHERAELGIRRAILEQELARLAARQASGKLDAAKETLSHYQIVAPCAGMVIAVASHRGEWVEPGQTVAQIVSTTRLRIDGFVDADVAGVDLIGQPVRIRFLAPDDTEGAASEEPIEGYIRFVSPEINPVDGTARISVEFSNPGNRFRAGSTVSARIALLGSTDR